MPFWKSCLIGSLAIVCLILATGCTPIVDRYREASSAAEDSHQVAAPVTANPPAQPATQDSGTR